MIWQGNQDTKKHDDNLSFLQLGGSKVCLKNKAQRRCVCLPRKNSFEPKFGIVSIYIQDEVFRSETG